MPPRPPSRWRFFIGAALTPLLLMALIIWTGTEYTRSVAAQESVVRSYEQERAKFALLSALKDAETAQRGFLLTGDEAFLAPYAPALAIARQLQARPAVVDPVLQRLIEAKVAELDKTIALFRAGQIATARAEVASGRGKRIMDRLRAHIAASSVTEHARTAKRAAVVAHHRHDTFQLLVVIGALFSLTLLAITMALWRSRLAQHAAAQAGHAAAERYAAILEGTSDTLLIVNPSGTIEMVNAAGADLLGYAPEELERRDLATVLRLGSGAGDFHERIGLKNGRPAEDFLPDQLVRRSDGSAVTVDVAIGVMHDADGDHLVLSLRDASGRVQVERAKDELISTVSHELRSPLTSIVGSLSLLRAAIAETWSQQERRLVDIADNNARRLIRLINDMLDIDRIESGHLQMALAPLDLRDVTAQATLDSEGMAQARGVTLVDRSAGKPVMVLGDAGRLGQVVTNLIANAVHASPAGQAVTVGARISAGRATVSVEDRGPGIPAALRARLFNRFESQRASGGTGLGLAISREIVRQLDGAIRFEDRVGGGTRFIFDLPLLPAPQVEPVFDSTLPMILHVEDDPDLRATVAAALAGIATVVPAAGLAAARSVLRTTVPRLALLDMQVIDGHGPTLIPDLIDRCGRDLPIVILSGQEVPRVMAARAAAVLTKGRDSVGDIVDTIRRLLATAEAAH